MGVMKTVDVEGAMALMAKYVNMPSGPWEKSNGDALMAVAAKDFDALGMTVRLRECEKVGAVIEARWGNQSKPLMLIGHMDTVFPQEESKPFAVEGGKASGAGVLDMKGGVAILHAALKCALTRLDPAKHGVVVLLNCDEELGSPESGKWILETAKGSAAALSFEPSRPGGAFVMERKGVRSFRLECGGIRGHSGARYKECASAIQELCQRIAKLYTLRDDERDISISIGVIQGGTAENVVADAAWAKGEYRSFDPEYQEEIRRKIQAICVEPGVPGTTTKLTFGAEHPALAASEQGRALYERARGIGESQGRKLGLERTGGAGDISIAGKAGIPVLDGFGMLGDGAHTLNEYVEIGAIGAQIELAERMIVGVLGEE
ncbi:MAG: M20/M25/M40 family metallo-hydrolase [Oscillospiraceae bacterium]|jgi:glutamate carboxypeptidase|nr:M20/M25/M40 family metallo-hydrolase [Oscillospiraceae bacterium]